jgi:hemerythrin-like domain-containing protein
VPLVVLTTKAPIAKTYHAEEMNVTQSNNTESAANTAHAQMSHGHTRLIWLLDDIEAHLQGLREGTDAPELILDELISYARAFTEELHGHIEEEETDIFPRAQAIAGAQELDELANLHDEHRHIETQMRAFWVMLSKACEEGHRTRYETCFDDLFERLLSIREHLTEHSSHERAFLTQVEQRLMAP